MLMAEAGRRNGIAFGVQKHRHTLSTLRKPGTIKAELGERGQFLRTPHLLGLRVSTEVEIRLREAT